MILTREAIFKAHKEGKIVVEPFNADLVSVNSVDVRLGSQVWKLKEKAYRDLYSPLEDDWISVPTVKVSSIRNQQPDFAKNTLSDEDEVFVFESGQFYLAQTLEKIGTSQTIKKSTSIVPEMKAKSTVGRQGLTVALCAGLGDVGYQSQWALEVRVTDDGHVPLAVGTPIAQVVFHMGTPTESFYNGEERYQNNEKVKFLPKPLKVLKE